MSDPFDEAAPRSGLTVHSLVRGLEVIRSFDAEHPVMTASDVARRTHLSRAATRRFLHTLCEVGYLSTDGKAYALTPRLLELGYRYLSGLGLPEIAQPHLQDLSERVRRSCSVSVLDGAEITYVARAATRRIAAIDITDGSRLPAYATSMGRVLIAGLPADERARFLADAALTSLTPHTITDRDVLERELERVRSRGWSVVDQELEEGLRSIAVPLHASDGRVIAALNVAMHAIGSTGDFVGAVGDALLETAQAIDADLALLPHRDPHPLWQPDPAACQRLG